MDMINLWNSLPQDVVRAHGLDPWDAGILAQDLRPEPRQTYRSCTSPTGTAAAAQGRQAGSGPRNGTRRKRLGSS